MSDVLVDEHLHRLIAESQQAYARCLDDDEGNGWPDFFDDECLYVITSADNYRRGFEVGLIYADSKGMLKDRIAALHEANIYEHHSYRHILSQPSILSRDGPLISCETSFIAVRIMRTGETSLFATGRYIDIYRLTDDRLLIRARRVVCDSNRIDTLLALPL